METADKSIVSFPLKCWFRSSGCER